MNTDDDVSTPVDPEDELLQTKFYCQIHRKNQMDVIFELSTDAEESISRTPHHYILLFDLSRSMNTKMKHNHRTLLERVKFFSELLVKNINEADWLSIVTFNHKADVYLPKTEMNVMGKTEAYQAIERMSAEGKTNLSLGLMTALEATQRTGDDTATTRDLIVLFTDGDANAGITIAEKLVKTYQQKIETYQLPCCIPLSAMTIGDYKPELLCKVSSCLGSDAFYWLHEDSDFEADMFTPVFLRNSTRVTDICVHLTCQRDDVILAEGQFSTEYMVNEERRKTEEPVVTPPPSPGPLIMFVTNVMQLISGSKENQDKVEEKGDLIGLKYFIHSLPNSMSKHIAFQLTLPENLENIKDEIILKARTTYRDDKRELRILEDNLVIPLNLRTMKRTQLDDPETAKDATLLAIGNNPEAQNILNNTSAYTMLNATNRITWKDAREAYVEEKHYECKRVTQGAFAEIAKGLDTEGYDFSKVLDEAKKDCIKLSETVMLVFGESDPHAIEMKRKTEIYVYQLESSKSLMFDETHSTATKWTVLRAREISLAKEMPTTSRVFDLTENQPQPFMPRPIQQQLDAVEQEVREVRPLLNRGPFRSTWGWDPK